MKKVALVLLLRARWFSVNKKDEDGRAIPELAVLMPALDELKTADLRPLARELEMRLNPVDADNLKQLADLLQLGGDDIARLASGSAAAASTCRTVASGTCSFERLVILGAGDCW